MRLNVEHASLIHSMQSQISTREQSTTLDGPSLMDDAVAAQASLIRTHISSCESPTVPSVFVSITELLQHTVSENTAASTSSLSLNMTGCSSTLMKMGWNTSGNVLEETVEEVDETLSDEMTGDEGQNEEGDTVLDWLGYLDFVEKI